MKLSKEDKTMFTMAGIMVVMIVTLSLLDNVNAQVIYDNVAEDEVIVCINGNIIEMSGNICKVFIVDGNGYFKQDITLDEVQKDLYQNPESDTFLMDVRD